MAVEQGLYKHFKGQFYQVIAVAKHSETQEQHVVYQPMYGERGIWIRPLAMFDETITREGQTFKRFALANDEEKQQFATEQD
ncbi:MAG: DUF1653 domain-containing protein [Algicola sp.]|nr:DUF1653 domain-containing protein [Algicola sp.]